ncbi:hypothetical protein TNCV_227291 [Trichonephila clavipes]|nr:hypothetical protein TNCV_227291 [Trichonephila clavipes]
MLVRIMAKRVVVSRQSVVQVDTFEKALRGLGKWGLRSGRPTAQHRSIPSGPGSQEVLRRPFAFNQNEIIARKWNMIRTVSLPYKESDFIKVQRIQWAGPVVTTKKVFNAQPIGHGEKTSQI